MTIAPRHLNPFASETLEAQRVRKFLKLRSGFCENLAHVIILYDVMSHHESLVK